MSVTDASNNKADKYLKNPFLDSGSDYWAPNDKADYDKKKAEFTTLFGISYPYDDPSAPEEESEPEIIIDDLN